MILSKLSDTVDALIMIRDRENETSTGRGMTSSVHCRCSLAYPSEFKHAGSAAIAHPAH